MKIDVLVAEIGSTTTVVNAFDRVATQNPLFVGQGQALTSVDAGDVTIGLRQAVDDLCRKTGERELNWTEMLATSSAAGGLRMSVHGLVYDMTVRAAREAALGAGAIVVNVTAGMLQDLDIRKIRDISPNIILLAGGVDYGERETVLSNFRLLSEVCPAIPLVYAGNVQNRDEVRRIADERGMHVYVVENVYPKVDVLNIEPVRKTIHDAFEKHITHAPGMAEIRKMVDGAIMPTPGAVMESARLLYDVLGDLVVFDVGGATTDVHSVTEGSAEIGNISVSPEPFAKRTVEGDLGVYRNMPHLVEEIGPDNLKKEIPDMESLIAGFGPIPTTPEQIRFVERLTLEAVLVSLERHAGRITHLYGPQGKKTVAAGKDLTAVKYVIGTGGALTRLPGRMGILAKTMSDGSDGKGLRLFPKTGAIALIDNHYIMASAGVLSRKYRDAAITLLKRSLAVTS